MDESMPERRDRTDDRALEFEEAPDDLDGLVVLDRNSHRVGEVDGLAVDTTDRRARMLVVGSGGILGLGRIRKLVPCEAVTEISDPVRIELSHRTVHRGDPLP